MALSFRDKLRYNQKKDSAINPPSAYAIAGTQLNMIDINDSELITFNGAKRRRDILTEGIAYQNKDIEFKLLSETYKEKSFEAYGLDLPRIKEVLPTNLPSVTANEKHMDNLFLLEDDTLAIVDYESEAKTKNHIKYVNYIGRVMERFYKENSKIPDIRLIVIYTGDVENARSVLEMPCMTLRMEQVFISELPEEEIYQNIAHKLAEGTDLTEQELMQLIILPLAGKGTENKQKRIEQVIRLAKLIKNGSDQIFVLTGLLVSTDKFINEESAGTIRRLLDMTKVGRILFEEGLEEGMEKGIEKGKHNTLQLINKIFMILKEEPGSTTQEIAHKLHCDENDVDMIRKMYP